MLLYLGQGLDVMDSGHIKVTNGVNGGHNGINGGAANSSNFYSYHSSSAHGNGVNYDSATLRAMGAFSNKGTASKKY